MVISLSDVSKRSQQSVTHGRPEKKKVSKKIPNGSNNLESSENPESVVNFESSESPDFERRSVAAKIIENLSEERSKAADCLQNGGRWGGRHFSRPGP